MTVNQYSSIHYLKDTQIGYFPNFPRNVIHGFSWGPQYHQILLNQTNPSQSIQQINDILTKLNLPDISKSVNLIPSPTFKNIYVNKIFAENLKPKPYGNSFTGSSIITDVPGVVLTVKPGDCTTTIIHAISEDNIEYTGLCHTGRIEVDNKIPIELVVLLQTKFNIKPENIHLGFVPHLSRDNRKFLHMNEFKNKDEWMKYSLFKDGFYYPGETEFALAQYIEAGVPENNIEEYSVDTFNIRYGNIVISHKYYVENHIHEPDIVEGRFLVVSSLKL